MPPKRKQKKKIKKKSRKKPSPKRPVTVISATFTEMNRDGEKMKITLDISRGVRGASNQMIEQYVGSLRRVKKKK